MDEGTKVIEPSLIIHVKGGVVQAVSSLTGKDIYYKIEDKDCNDDRVDDVYSTDVIYDSYNEYLNQG